MHAESDSQQPFNKMKLNREVSKEQEGQTPEEVRGTENTQSGARLKEMQKGTTGMQREKRTCVVVGAC